MSIYQIEKTDPTLGFYNMRDKLQNHVAKRSEECFLKAKQERDNIKNADELKAYNKKMREVFLNSIGGNPYDASLPLNAQTVGKVEEEGLTIEKVIFQSRPDVYVTANLYIPHKREKKCGGVLFQIGHGVMGKSQGQYQRVARQIASAGLIVLIFDPVGQGERLSYFESEINSPMVPGAVHDHGYAGNQCVLLGEGLIRYFLCDAMRSVDYLQSREEVDADKIGATGSSGGGTMTSVLMMMDDRIKAAAPGTFITTRKEYYYADGAQDSEQIWFGATKMGLDHYELVCSFAPKPLLLLTVRSDFFPIEGSEDVLYECKRFWKMYAKEDHIAEVRDDSRHAYTDHLAQAAAVFFAENLNGETYTVDTSLVKSLPASQLNCTQTGQVRTSIKNAKFIFDENIERLKKCEKRDNIKEYIENAMNYERKEEKLHVRIADERYENGLSIKALLWFSQRQMPNFGLLFSSFNSMGNETVICLWDKGTDDIETYIHKIREICDSGKNALVLDLSGVGKCAPNPIGSANALKEHYGALDKISKDLFFLGDSLCALRLYELKCAINMIKEEIGGSVSIFATGMSAHYARLWKIIEPKTKIELLLPAPCYTQVFNSKYYENYNIAGVILPGIIRYL